MRRSTILCGLAVATTLGVLATGCSDDDDGTVAAEQTLPPPAAGTVPEPAITTPTSHTTSHPPESTDEPTDTSTPGRADVIDVVLSDYAFGGLPERVPVGTKLRVENISHEEIHELVAFRLPDGESRPVDELLQLPDAEQATLFESEPPAMVLLAPPGGEQISALGDGTLAEAGRYVVLCAIPTGADPVEFLEAAAEATDGPPQVEGGPPHFTKGMLAEVIVE